MDSINTYIALGSVAGGVIAVVLTTVVLTTVLLRERKKPGQKPLSVNYHFTRQCNYQCGFCFHTAKTSFVLPLQEAKRGIKLLKEAG